MSNIDVSSQARNQTGPISFKSPEVAGSMAGRITRTVLLICGILSSLLYIAMNVVVPMQWQSYSSASQTVSELSAIGAPTRSLWVLLAAFYTILVTAFGWGVRKTAGRARAPRIVGGLILAYGALGLVWPFAPMHLRDVLAAGGSTLSDTLHIAIGIVTVVLMFLAMGFGAAAFGKAFRVYSIASLVLLVGFGALTFSDAPRLSANLPTPWIGIWERINIGVFLLWIVVLATTLLRIRGTVTMANRPSALAHSSPFRTPEGEAAYLSAYDDAMKVWPVPYEETDVPSRFGMTHVVVSGPEDGPPLVLLHGYMATLTMWSPSVAEFAKDHRVYAIDVMGQPGKSIPAEAIRNTADFVAWLKATLDALHLDRVSLVGMSYGGWLALAFAVVAPERLQRLVLLSPAASFLPIVRQFSLRGMLMMFFPTRLTVNSFMRWLGFTDAPGDTNARRVLDLMYLGLKHYRIPPETLRIAINVFSDHDLRAMRLPVLLLIGDHEVIYDPEKALARARRLLPEFSGDLVPRSSHDMCFSQHRIVNVRVLEFLKGTRTDDRGKSTERAVA